VPRKPLDAPEDVPKQALRQVTLCQIDELRAQVAELRTTGWGVPVVRAGSPE